jgi:hypothetical protein
MVPVLHAPAHPPATGTASHCAASNQRQRSQLTRVPNWCVGLCRFGEAWAALWAEYLLTPNWCASSSERWVARLVLASQAPGRSRPRSPLRTSASARAGAIERGYVGERISSHLDSY